MRLGIDLGGTKIEGVKLDGEREVFRERIATPDNYADAIDAIARLVAMMERDEESPLPLGIGTPGAWVEAKKVMKNCNSTWLNGRPLKDDLEAVLKRPIVIENDANCFALSEAAAFCAGEHETVFGVILGTGVGGGIVSGGHLLTGANAIGGEWGHTPLPYFRQDDATIDQERGLADRPCFCGRMNCVERFLSGPGLAETHQELTGEQALGERIPTDGPAMDLYVVMLARALAQIINVIDPHLIVLGGGVSNIDRLYQDVPGHLPRYAFSHEGFTRIERARGGDSSGVLGAARLVGESLPGQ